MKVFLDTNVLVAACIEEHEHHSRALPVMESVWGKVERGVTGALFGRCACAIGSNTRPTMIQTAIEDMSLIRSSPTNNVIGGREYETVS